MAAVDDTTGMQSPPSPGGPAARRPDAATSWPRRLCAAALALTTASCGHAALDGSFASSAPEDPDRVLERVHNDTARLRIPAAVGVTGRGLVGRRLPDGPRWTSDLETNVLPSLADDLVVFTHGEWLTALDVETGLKRFTVDGGGRRLEGLGYDGKRLVLLLVDQDDARRDQIRIIDRQGVTLHEGQTLERLGTPALVAGVALMPWAGRYVSAFSLAEDGFLGRLSAAGGVHTVEARSDHVWLYGEGAQVLGHDTDGSKDQLLQLEARSLPGQPTWPPDGSKPRPASARDVWLSAYPVLTKAGPRFSHNGFALVYREALVGFDASSQRVRWATHFERSAVGGTTNRTGPVVCLEDGSIRRVRMTDGGNHPEGSLNSRLRACVVQMPEQEVPAGPRPPLREQVHRTITATGPDLAPVHELLLEDLGQRPGRLITESLLAIARDPLTSATLSRQAGELLARRKSGSELMLAALRESRTALGASGLRPAPLAPLAEALSAMGVSDAAPLLAEQLRHPSVSGEEALAILLALGRLGTGPVEPVEEFLATHRSVGGSSDMIDAQVEAAAFLLERLPQRERDELRRTLADALTHPSLRAALETRGLLTPSSDG